MDLIDDILIPSKHGKKTILGDIRWVTNGQQKPVIIFIHGFKGFKDWGYFNLLADFFSKQGFVFAKLNLSHNGTTPEHPTEFVDLNAFAENNFTKELDDLGSFIDFLCSSETPVPSNEINPEMVFLLGHSRGGGLAILKSKEDDRVKAVAALAPVHNLKKQWTAETLKKWENDGFLTILNSRTGQEMKMNYQIVQDTLKNYDRFDIPNTIHNMTIPLFVAHGTNDETLPVENAHEIKTWKEDAILKIIAGANHTFGGQHPYEGKGLPEDIFTIAHRIADFYKRLSPEV
jgi:pimeloyl-ACP methyl ester carboxylesterase